MNSSKPLLLIFDADVLVFQSTAAVETETNWGDDFWTLHSDLGEAKTSFQQSVKTIVRKVLTKLHHKGDYEILMCFSDTTNFRKIILPSYKFNRKGKRKPCAYAALKQWVCEEYNSKILPLCEGDDACSVLGELHGNAVIISIDKDMKTTAVRYYDFNKEVLWNSSVEQSKYWWLYQCLVGDVTDGYSGAKGIGAKTAEKILSADCSWEAVVKAYESKGLTETDALTQARVARILHSSDYNMETGEIYLWSPEGRPRDTLLPDMDSLCPSVLPNKRIEED